VPSAQCRSLPEDPLTGVRPCFLNWLTALMDGRLISCPSHGKYALRLDRRESRFSAGASSSNRSKEPQGAVLPDRLEEGAGHGEGREALERYSAAILLLPQ
jgi:hypothetical protein